MTIDQIDVKIIEALESVRHLSTSARPMSPAIIESACQRLGWLMLERNQMVRNIGK